MQQSIVATRSFDFALSAVGLYKRLISANEFILSKQLLRSATSIGANVQEALAGQTKKDFVFKMAIASKEARETKYWLLLLEKSELVSLDYSPYLKEIEHLINMLTKIVKTTQTNLKDSN